MGGEKMQTKFFCDLYVGKEKTEINKKIAEK